MVASGRNHGYQCSIIVYESSLLVAETRCVAYRPSEYICFTTLAQRLGTELALNITVPEIWKFEPGLRCWYLWCITAPNEPLTSVHNI